MNNQAIDKQISKAKLNLFTQPNTTFFSCLLANLRLEISEEVPTAGTDGLSLVLNPNFIKTLDIPETIGLLLHEVMHCVYEHMHVQKTHSLDSKVWNIAGDYLINGELDKLNYKLPKDRLLNHKYDGMSTKQIYDILMQENQDQFNNYVMDLRYNTPDGMTEQEKKEAVLTNIVKAVTQARLSNDHGSIPGHVARTVEEILNPKLPWNTVLQNYMSAYAKDEYSWSRPNRRYMPDFYLPSMHSEALNQITVGIDVSGSISQSMLDAFLAEVRYIWDIMKPKSLRTMTFDTEVRYDETVHEGDVIEGLKCNGGGGTNIGPLIDSLHKDSPELCIVFTDGYFSNPHLDDITTDLFWIIIGDNDSFKPSRGEVINYE